MQNGPIQITANYLTTPYPRVCRRGTPSFSQPNDQTHLTADMTQGLNRFRRFLQVLATMNNPKVKEENSSVYNSLNVVEK